MNEIQVYVDCGCKGNGTSNAKSYGSFAVVHNNKVKRYESFDLPTAETNNQAEYQSLIKALEYLSELASRCDTRNMRASIHMDSALVINQVNRKWKVKSSDLLRLTIQARDKLYNLRGLYNMVELLSEHRVTIVNFLGH